MIAVCYLSDFSSGREELGACDRTTQHLDDAPSEAAGGGEAEPATANTARPASALPAFSPRQAHGARAARKEVSTSSPSQFQDKR